MQPLRFFKENLTVPRPIVGRNVISFRWFLIYLTDSEISLQHRAGWICIRATGQAKGNFPSSNRWAKWWIGKGPSQCNQVRRIEGWQCKPIGTIPCRKGWNEQGKHWNPKQTNWARKSEQVRQSIILSSSLNYEVSELNSEIISLKNNPEKSEIIKQMEADYAKLKAEYEETHRQLDETISRNDGLRVLAKKYKSASFNIYFCCLRLLTSKV